MPRPSKRRLPGRHPLLAPLSMTLALALAPSASAQETPATETPPVEAPAPETPAVETLPRPKVQTTTPTTAVAALDRASAAYEYGDMTQVVDATRPIIDGALPATEAERAQALRFLGIGLFLTGRQGGAEPYFVELLRLRPRIKLDPATTRPEVVAFFEEIRRRHADELNEVISSQSRRTLAWSFLPPLGQFQNGDRMRGWIILGFEAAALAGAVTTRLVLESWRGSGDTFEGRTNTASALRTINHVSVALLAITYIAGVTDALLRDRGEPDERTTSLTFVVLPTGAGLAARF